MGFKLSVPAKLLSKELNQVSKKTKKAGVRALNKAAVQSRNFAQRETGKVINVKAAAIKKNYRVIKAKTGQKIPEAEIVVKYTRFPVILFRGVRQTRKGVTVVLRKDNPRKLFKAAFIETMPSGHKGAFRRKGRRRLPIKELLGPSAQSIFIEKLGSIEKQSGLILEKVYARELDFIFTKG